MNSGINNDLTNDYFSIDLRPTPDGKLWELTGIQEALHRFKAALAQDPAVSADLEEELAPIESSDCGCRFTAPIRGIPSEGCHLCGGTGSYVEVHWSRHEKERAELIQTLARRYGLGVTAEGPGVQLEELEEDDDLNDVFNYYITFTPTTEYLDTSWAVLLDRDATDHDYDRIAERLAEAGLPFMRMRASVRHIPEGGALLTRDARGKSGKHISEPVARNVVVVPQESARNALAFVKYLGCWVSLTTEMD